MSFEAEEFRRVYLEHVERVVAGDSAAALADMAPGSVPAVFRGVIVPRGPVAEFSVVSMHQAGGHWVGEVVYGLPTGPIGLRSTWDRHQGTWKATALENFSAPEDLSVREHDRAGGVAP